MEIERPRRRGTAPPAETPKEESPKEVYGLAPLRSEENETEDQFDYDKDLSIDPNYLDAEFLNHPMVFMKYCKAAAQANKAAKMAEERVKTVRSIIVKREREGLTKHTETTLEAAYRLDPDYRAAKQDWVNATFKADLLTNAVFAFQARKSALENLVRLHGQEYFSTPQEPRDLPEAAKRLQEIKDGSAVNHIKERMRRS